ncbi:hypothetical protein ANANG_G00275260 [Anguilla anguilla]|uniref:Uncharacterized protein n=1 Tax=Anguilla anguilla TaxID=7936 RepID=A0A9D3LMI9_ANGAN|nr:hypothetical protein ANANG_G00275260 [Anguilla anguilla]
MGTAAAAVRIQAWWRGLSTRRFHPLAKEVRSEIRLRRMQEHIVYLSAEMERMQREQEEERLQRLVQEEAVRFLWTQLQSVLEWQRSVQEQLQGASRSQLSGQPPLQAAAASTLNPACSEASFPDSGFQSTGDPQGALEDSLCSGTGESVETVRAGRGGGAATEGGRARGPTARTVVSCSSTSPLYSSWRRPRRGPATEQEHPWHPPLSQNWQCVTPPPA